MLQQVQPRARASKCSDWIFGSVFKNENPRAAPFGHSEYICTHKLIEVREVC